MKIVIVGGVAGGASAAARLRRLDEYAQIVLLEKGPHISFANCGLPYYIGGEIQNKSDLLLQTPQSFATRFGVDVRVDAQVTSINRDKQTVMVCTRGETYEESYDKLILSPGGESIVPPIAGLPLPNVFTLRNIPDTERIAAYVEGHSIASAMVVGGGYIGIEMAENLIRRGISVTLVEQGDQVLAPLDYDMAQEVQHHMRQQGVHLLLGSTVTAIEEAEQSLMVTVNGQQMSTDLMLLAVGVKPDAEIARKAGLAVNERGAIIVDEHMITSDANIYAVGDAVEVTEFVTGQKATIPLAGPANKQGRMVADHICGMSRTYGGTQGSSILRMFDMTIATTGINEKTAKRLGLDYEKSFTYSPSHATYYPGATFMSIKLLFERQTGKILGGQIVGFDGVDKRCDVLATVIRLGGTVFDLTQLELCYAPPYSSAKDPINMAGFAAENIQNGIVKPFHWHDIAQLQQRSDVTLLDTRTPGEYQRGRIDGFCNIPLDELRQRLEELDPAKPIYVHCQSGMRSYLACRILSQHGFDCYNLSGGYRLYRVVTGA